MITPANIEPSICMERPLAGPLPAVQLPPGFTIRPLAVGEDALWEGVMDAAYGIYGEHYAPGDFQSIIVENYDYAPNRVRILLDGDSVPCGTATSWRQHYRWGPGVGYILFVGVIPTYTGRKFGYALTLHLLHDFAARGFHTAILETDDHFLPALKTYLNLGFRPRLVHENQVERWAQIFQRLGIAPAAYNPSVRPPIAGPHPARPWPWELGGES